MKITIRGRIFLWPIVALRWRSAPLLDRARTEEEDMLPRSKTSRSASAPPRFAPRSWSTASGDGDLVIATWPEIRKDHVGDDNTTRNEDCRNGSCVSTSGRTRWLIDRSHHSRLSDQPVDLSIGHPVNSLGKHVETWKVRSTR